MIDIDNTDIQAKFLEIAWDIVKARKSDAKGNDKEIVKAQVTNDQQLGMEIAMVYVNISNAFNNQIRSVKKSNQWSINSSIPHNI
jgi:hypothetical protein